MAIFYTSCNKTHSKFPLLLSILHNVPDDTTSHTNHTLCTIDPDSKDFDKHRKSPTFRKVVPVIQF